jgi:hypothetical protein
VQQQPALFDSAIKASPVFCWRCLVLVQHRSVDLFDINRSVLNGLEGMSKLEDLARRCFRVGIGRGWTNFISQSPWSISFTPALVTKGRSSLIST